MAVIGKTVIVTGGASGIGLALVRFFATRFATIVVINTSAASAQSVLPSLREEHPGTMFISKLCDISNWEDQATVFKEIFSETGSVDIVCANAGVTEVSDFLEGDEGEPQKPNLKTLDVNLVGTLYSIKLAVHYMRKNTFSQKGLILVTSSNAGLYPFPTAPLYGISKHAAVGAIRSLAEPLKHEGIRINGFCPNVIATSIADDKLLSNMVTTPMSTLIDAANEFVTNETLTGVNFEISGSKFTSRSPPDFVDDMTELNLNSFLAMGHA